MQILIFILLIILILFLIFRYSKEHFQDGETTAASTTQVIDSDAPLIGIGFNNLNKHNILSCTHSDDQDATGSPINAGDDENYSQCFTDATKDKFIEIDKENKRCHIYTGLDCTNNDDKSKLVSNPDFSNKVVFILPPIITKY